MGDKTPNVAQQLTPGVYVIPTQVQQSGGFWKKVIITLFSVILVFILMGAIQENFQLRRENSLMEGKIRSLEFVKEIHEERIRDLKEEIKELKESLSRSLEENQRVNANELRVWRPQAEYSWMDYAKPIGVGAAISLGLGWLTGGLSLSGQFIVGAGGSIATKALGF